MGILIAAVMIFGLMPGLTQVAHAAETIKNVAVTGFVKPETSATAITIDALSVPADAPYSIKRISWESSNTVPAEGGFQFDDSSGEQVYRLMIKLEADSGYSFASISQFESYTLNGGTELLGKCEIDSDGFFRMYTNWYTPVAPETTTISSVSLTVTEPTAGAPVLNNAGVSAESGANYTVVESGWLQNDGAGGSEYTTDTEFQAGKTYLLFATLSPNEGYQFSEGCTGKVNDADADDYYRRTPDLIVYKEFTIPAPITEYPVWVGSTQVTSANKDDILGDGGKAKYDSDTHTLTLNNPTITGEPSSVSGAKIYIYDSSVTYTIDGTATIDGDIVMGNGWTADLVIKGNITAKRVVNPDHSVTVNGNLTLNSSSGFALRASSITIASGTVDVTGSDYGIEGGTVTISGGTVMAKASSSTGSAIHAYTALSIAVTHEIVLPAGGVLSSDGKDVCESDGTTIATEAKVAPKETVTEYPVWVGDTQVTSANKDDILGDGGKAKFDPDTNTLTLNDPDITELHNGAKIYATGINLTVSGSVSYVDCDYGIQVNDGDLTLSDGCSISIMAVDSALIATNITILGGTVTVKGTDNNGRGIHAINNITISGGTVTAMGTDIDGIGIYAVNTITFSGDSTQVMAKGDLYSIYAGCGISISSPLAVVEPEGASVAEIKEGESFSYFTIEDEEGIFANDVVIKKAGSTTTYPVWVGSTQVTSANKDDILGDGGKATFDPDTNTLTLNDPTVSGSHADGIICYNPSSGDPELLKITGSATLGDGSTFAGILGIESAIELNGTFDVTGTECGVEAFNVTISGGTVTAHGGVSGIATYKDISITGGTVNATGDTKYGIGSDTKSVSISGGTVAVKGGKAGIDAENNIIITGGTVNAESVDAGTDAITAGGDISISNADVTAHGDGGGIYADGKMSISGNSVKASGLYCGIEAFGDISITGGTVEAVSSNVDYPAIKSSSQITIGEGLEIITPEGGKISDDKKSIVNPDGTAALDVLIKAGEVPFVEYDVWVGSTRVTSANKDDILGDGGKAKYDPDTNTLTLNDPTVTGSYEGAKIYAKAMTLTVTGKVTLSGADFGIDVRGYSGYLGRLIITGNGTNIDAAGNTSGISAKDGVIINGGTIRASGSVAGISSATISISGEANVTATASAEPDSYGIYASSGIGIFDATVTVTAGDGIGATGIYSKAGDITISGGTVTVTAGAGGIYAYDGEVKIENGTAKVEATVGTVAVRGKNGITIGDELMIKLPEGGTVESNSGSYDIMDGSSVARHALIVPKEATTYTVTFDVNGHGTAPAAQTVEDGKTATKPADPTETGWTFGGWYKEAACTSTFDFSTPITADITLYAKWTEESVTPGVITYTVVSGGDSTWIKDSTSTITITVKRSEADDTCFSHFTGVQIDGTALAASDYEAKAGSTVITLKAATLQKLSTGSHTVTVIFDDGKAETSVTVKAAASPADSKSPKTGDSNHMGLWIILMIISVIWLGTAVLIRKKNRYTSKH